MPLPIILLVLAAATFHAIWNAAVKHDDDKLLSLSVMHFGVVLLVLPLVPFVGLPHPDSWGYLAASVFFHSGYYLSLARAYRVGDFAQAYPVARGTAPIIVTLFGVLVLGEALNLWELLSVIGVIGGIMIFATHRLSTVLHHRAALTSALLTSAFIGGYTLLDGVGGRLSQNIPAYIVWLSILNGIPMTFCALQQRGWSQVRVFLSSKSRCQTSMVAAALGLAAYWIVVWAMTRAPIPLVAALRETSIIIAALIGAYYFKEPAGKRRIIASVVIFFSIALLGLSEASACFTIAQ